MSFFMTKCKIYISLLACLILIQCADARVARKAIKNNCSIPSTNHAFLEIVGIEPTGTTKDLTGFYKYFTYVFKQPFFDVEDRCRHTNLVVEGLNDNDDYKVHYWENRQKKTSGKMAVFLTREYHAKLCRDYYTIIRKGDKKYFWQGTACIGSSAQLSKQIIGYHSHWHFYNYQPDQSGGRPILESWGTYNDAEHPNVRQSRYKFHCTKTPWKCR